MILYVVFFKRLRQIAFPVSLFVVVDCVLRRVRGVMATIDCRDNSDEENVLHKVEGKCLIIQVNFLLICIFFRS